MTGFLDNFRQKVILAVYPEQQEDSQMKPPENDAVDNLIALGVLLWVVAEADEKFLPEEKTQVEEALKAYGKISNEDMPIVLRAIKEASLDRIDLYAFTSEVGNNLSFTTKIGIIENLFRVACVDQDLANEEHEMIRNISGLLRIDHKDFIDTKIKIKKEFGLDTAGL